MLSPVALVPRFPSLSINVFSSFGTFTPFLGEERPNPTLSEALLFLPSSYVRMLKESKADVFVMRPCVEWIPILLPMVATFAPKAVVCQVPHRLDPETSKWLMNKCQDGRVRFLTSSPEPETQAKSQWVIVFQNKFLKKQFCGYNLDDRVDHDYQLALFELMYAHNF